MSNKKTKNINDEPNVSKLVCHLDWHDLNVPDVAAQLYHRLHGGHCLLYGAVNKVSPGNTAQEGTTKGDYKTTFK